MKKCRCCEIQTEDVEEIKTEDVEVSHTARLLFIIVDTVITVNRELGGKR